MAVELIVLSDGSHGAKLHRGPHTWLFGDVTVNYIAVDESAHETVLNGELLRSEPLRRCR